jgi:hypothetical protein
MKFADYKRLGKISIEARSKSTRNTILGISMGLIIIIPILFFALAFNVGLSNKINAVKSISTLSFQTKHFTDSSPTSVLEKKSSLGYFNYGLLSFDKFEEITSLNGVEEYLVSEYFEIALNRYPLNNEYNYSKLIIEDTLEYNININEYVDENDKAVVNGLVKVCHPELSEGKYFTNSELDDLKTITGESNPYAYGTGFKGNGKGQIVVSQYLIEAMGIKPSLISGRKVSLSYLAGNPGLVIIDDNTNPFDLVSNDELKIIEGYYDIIKDYEIVGIVNKALYELPSRENEAHIWLTKSSVYNEDNKSSLPIITKKAVETIRGVEEYNVVTYANSNIVDYVNSTTSEGMVFIPIGFGGFYSSKFEKLNIPASALQTIIQCKNFNKTIDLQSKVDKINSEAFPEGKEILTNEYYDRIKVVSLTGRYVILILISFGGIILFATLLNLYNSINYSVNSRRNYMGVMRAIGSPQKSIPKLYFVEIIIIFVKSIIWVVSFSCFFSYAIKIAVDIGFRKIQKIFPFSISLNFWYYPLTLFIVLVFEFIVAFVYSQITCRHVANEPILEVLKDEK